MAINYPAVGLVINPAADGTVDVPTAHLLNASQFSMMGVTNAAGGTVDYPMTTMTGLGLALSRRNPNAANELDLLCYGNDGLGLLGIFGAITTAVNAGFTHGVAATGDPLTDGMAIIRKAMTWAQTNVTSLRPLMAADFYVLPALAGGGNPPRVRISYSLFVEPSTLLMRAATEVVCLGGFVHTPASRNATSRYALFYETVVDQLSTPPLANQPEAVARVFLQSGLPPQLAVYPVALGERYSHILLRFHYIGGSHAERRAAFCTYAPLLLQELPLLRSFVTPSLSDDMTVDAYSMMASRIFRSMHAPADQSTFLFRTASDLSSMLAEMPEIPQQANTAVPVQNASSRALAAVTEWDRRRTVVNSSAGGGGVAPSDGTAAVSQVPASKTLRSQLTSALMPQPFFAPAEADIVRLNGMAPNNEFPCLKRAMVTKNVIFVQVAVGRLRGVSDISPGMGIIESCSSAFAKYVDHTTVMDKAPAAVPGRRPPHTMAYNQEEFTRNFLLNQREKFLKQDLLSLSNKIKSAREQILEQPIDRGAKLFASAENIPLLKYFGHFLEAFEFDRTGPGSWEEALDKMERFRQGGLSMPGESRVHHFDNCGKAFDILLGELFDSIGHFAQAKEASKVDQLLSRRVFEPNGAFEQHLTFQNTGTSSLNQILMLNPAFAKVMGGPSGVSGGESSSASQGEEEQGSGGKFKASSQAAGYVYKGGLLTFGNPHSGPTYDTKAIWEAIRKVEAGLGKHNFCMLQYLSINKKICKSQAHRAGKFHKYAPHIMKLRSKFEHAPFRTDAKAKPAE